MNNPSGLTPEQALLHIQRTWLANRDVVTRHAQEQMRARRISAIDVQHAVSTATHAVYRPEDDSWRLLGGVDTEDVPTEPRVSIKPNCVTLVTVT